MLDEGYAAPAAAFGLAVQAVQSWDAASPCEGWTARDVLGHVIETQREFLGMHDVALGDAPDLADPPAAWATHDAAVRAAFADPSVGSSEFAGYFGPTTVGVTWTQIYGFDLIVHRWDLAESDGRVERLGEGELDRLEAAIQGFGEALYSEGICKPALTTGPDADRQEQILARLGRATHTHAAS